MHALIGLDWGTSSLRGTLYDSEGLVRATRNQPWGIRHLPQGGFEAALAAMCDGWPDVPMLASGMVGSRQGWLEAPYVDVPATLGDLAASCIEATSRDGRRMAIVPGVRDPESPDVMRGEEVQVFGAMDARPGHDQDACIVLPGTHSKWVRVRHGGIVKLQTYMTGELYAVLRRHSILGADLPDTEANDESAFLEGVGLAQACGNAGGLSRLFQTRARMLAGDLDRARVPDFLSGLLIGEELRAARAAGIIGEDESPLLAGDDALCQRYRSAARAYGWDWPEPVTDAAARGLWKVGTLLKSPNPPMPTTHAAGNH